LLIKCPPNGYEKWRLVQFFYQGLSQPNRSMIESMNGGAFLNLKGDLAYKALDKLADNSQQWNFTSCRDKSVRNPKRWGILELKGETELAQRMDAIVKRLDALSVGKPVNAANTFPVESCSVCVSLMHQAQNCPSMTVFAEMEQVNAFNNFQKTSSGCGGTTLISLESRINPPQIKEESTSSKSLSFMIFFLSWMLGSASVIIILSSPNIINTVIGRDHEGLYKNDWSINQ
jgi:hypothetical protein